jgi:protein ImuB
LLREPEVLIDAPQGLQLLEGPERIETGWWDGREVARDYYVARDDSGAELWVYRERLPPHAWYLHGVFG